MDHPHAIRENIVDFHDGTYGVRLGDNFYRVDNDLPVRTNSNTPVYAGLGAEGSMWVAIMEKAYAFHRTIYDSYSSLNGGWSIEALRAFRAPSPGEQSIASYGNATALANSLYSRWLNYENVTVGFSGGRITTGAPLVNNHMYTVWSFRRNTAGQITSIVLRNPWGTDGAGNDGSDDGFVTVTPAQLFGCTGRVNWGRV
jgi:hypothetical protein